MRYGWILCLVTTVIGQAIQTPFSSKTVAHPHGESWDLTVLPHNNSTGHLIFDTVSSVLQHWPNTRYRNGHNIIPATISPGTILYHGRTNSRFPTEPEWAATDPEHVYIFCSAICWQLTLVVTRPLKLIYFDGSAAAKMPDGPLDSQDMLIWGESSPKRVFDERERLHDLCDWGKGLGLDGFVRMEFDFEVMICDFTVGLEVVSFLNIIGNDPEITIFRPQPPHDHDHMENRSPSGSDSSRHGTRATWFFESINSGTYHDRFPGDTRIHLDLSRFVSFYDLRLAPSLVEKRRGQERWDHRLEGIDRNDLDAVKERLRDVLIVKHKMHGSGVDWQSLFVTIIKRYGARLEMLRYILETDSETLGSEKDRVIKAYTQIEVMLAPYTLTSAIPPNSTADSGIISKSWASPVFRLCATAHTTYIASSTPSLTPSERLLLSSVQETTREICRVLVVMWSDGLVARVGDQDWSPGPDGVREIMAKWGADLKGLMDWLDWSLWIRCKPACGFEEICYLPTWPFIVQGDRDVGARERPQPKCIRRVEPHSLSVLYNNARLL